MALDDNPLLSLGKPARYPLATCNYLNYVSGCMEGTKLA